MFRAAILISIGSVAFSRAFIASPKPKNAPKFPIERPRMGANPFKILKLYFSLSFNTWPDSFSPSLGKTQRFNAS